MKKRLVVGAVVVLACVVAAYILGCGRWVEEPKPTVAQRCLPPETLAYAEIPDYEGSKERFKQTALYKIWMEPDVQEFAKPLLDMALGAFGDVKQKFVAEVGMPFDDLSSLFSGQMAIALINVNLPKPQMDAAGGPPAGADVVEAALFLTPKEPAKIKMIIEKLQAYLQKEAKELMIQTVNYGKVPVTEICSKTPSDPTAAHAWLGETFVLTVGPRDKTMRGIISRWSGETKESMSGSPNFIAARKRVRTGEGDFIAYAAVRDILQRLDPMMAPEARSALEASGLTGITSASYGLSFDGPGVRDTLYVHTGPERRGFVAALTPVSLDEKLLDLVPQEATTCLVTRFNPALLWQTTDALVRALNSRTYQDFRKGLESASDAFGMDLEKDVIPTFGDYAVLYSQSSQMGGLLYGLLDWVAVVGLKDRKKAEAIGDMVRSKTGDLMGGGSREAQMAVWQTMKVGNATGYYVTIPFVSMVGLAPGYAIVDDKVVIALSLQSLRTAVTQAATPGPSLRKRADFAAVYAKLPKGAGLIGYSDVKTNFTNVYLGVTPMLPQIMSGINRSLPGGTPRMEMGKFPPPEAFTKHLFGSVAIVKGEENGIVMESYGAASLNAGAGAGAAIIAAVAVPNLLRSRMAANESTTIGSLKTVATQQAIFRQQAEVDQNGNGAGEYGLLGELAGEIALRPATTRVANPAYLSQQFRTGGNGGTGIAQKSGYMYKIYLSNATSADRSATGDDKTLGGNTTTGGPKAAAEALPIQESSFAVYAWPAEVRSTGARAFFVNEVGEVYATKMEAKTYDGAASCPAANAAYIKGGEVFKSRISSGATKGGDGNQWLPAGY